MGKWTPEPWTIAEHGRTIDGDPWFSINRGAVDVSHPSTCIASERWSTNSFAERRANAERIVACVNALAVIRNPAAVPGLIEAARKANSILRPGNYELTEVEWVEGWEVIDEINAALAALDAAPGEEAEDG